MKSKMKRWQTIAKVRELTAQGKMISIIRASKKDYNVIINGVIEKNYKQRHSCNRYIEKL